MAVAVILHGCCICFLFLFAFFANFSYSDLFGHATLRFDRKKLIDWSCLG